jgi:adenylate cyclase
MARKVLLVDDSNLIRGLVTEHLESKGYEVVSASNGLEGILSVYRELPDIVVTDVEMPKLQGYQMSRLMKSRRGVRDIPVIMHTSLSEDRDKFWASSSGADGFISKDFDNLELIDEKIEELLSAPGVQRNEEVIREDAKEMDETAAMEMLGNLFDKELFQSVILNRLSEVVKYMGSLSITALEILKLLGKVCETHLSVLVIHYHNDAQVYSLPSKEVHEADVEKFIQLALQDFRAHMGELKIGEVKKSIYGIEDREDWQQTRIDGKRLSSYFSLPLKGKGESVIGTVHVGNLTNNYFSSTITDNIEVFVRGAGVVLENAILFKTINEMEHKINTIFSKFVPPEVIKDLLSQGEDTEMKVGEKRSVAILFSDIRSFTVVSENNSAEKIVSFLNSYFQRMVSIIKEQGGVVDKFIGDAILAIFGAPVSYPDNAERAAAAAVGMIEALGEIDTEDLVLPEAGFQIGIGVHEGTVIVGNIGSRDKFDYTVIGDNVNLASRLEGLTKHYKSSIILSDTVAVKVEGLYPLREVDTVKVKGKEQATTLYSVVGEGAGGIDEAAAEDYKKGLQMYRLGNWSTAKEYFEKVRVRFPQDHLSALYIDRCDDFAENPPDEDWGGAVSLDFK